MESCEEVKLEYIIADFERGLNSAFRTTFDGVTILGCDFHWKSLLRKRIAADGLLSLYNSDSEFHRLVRYIWALAYVPDDQVVRVWDSFIQEKIRANLESWNTEWGAGIEQFLKYVQVNWIGELNPRTRIRKKPAYPMAMWNKHMPTRLGFRKTNNMAEGYNHAFGLSVPANATVWALIERFREEESIMKQSLFQAAKGNISGEDAKSRSVKRKLREAQFQAVVGNFQNMPLKMFKDEIVPFLTNELKYVSTS
jgi:hypothetical protein